MIRVRIFLYLCHIIWCVEKMNNVWQMKIIVMGVGLCFHAMMWAQGHPETGTYYEQAAGEGGDGME